MPAGQSQKEAFVNEGLSLIDALLHCAIEGEVSTPPTSPQDGGVWLVGSGATGAWAGHQGALACRQSGQWLLVEPCDGMRILNRVTGQEIRRRDGVWIKPAAPALPSGGSVVDVELRAMIADLVAKLRDAGIFARL